MPRDMTASATSDIGSGSGFTEATFESAHEAITFARGESPVGSAGALERGATIETARAIQPRFAFLPVRDLGPAHLVHVLDRLGRGLDGAAQDDAQVRVHFMAPSRSDATYAQMSPHTLLARLCALVRAPRFHEARYCGVLASRHALSHRDASTP